MLSLHQLIFCNDVVADKLLDLNLTVVVSVTFAEKFVNDLATVVFVDAFLSEKNHHFVFVDVAIAVDVDHSEFVVELALLLSLVLRKLLVGILHVLN